MTDSRSRFRESAGKSRRSRGKKSKKSFPLEREKEKERGFCAVRVCCK